MGRVSTTFKIFVSDIPDGKLSGFTSGEQTLYKNDNYRLNLHGATTGYPQYYNIQVQASNEPSPSKKVRGTTVAYALVPTDGSWSAQNVRDALLSNSQV